MAPKNKIPVTITLSDDVIATIERIDKTAKQLAEVGTLINAVADRLKGLNLGLDDIAGVIASRAGTSKTSVTKVFAFLRQTTAKSLSGDEIIAHHLSAKTGTGIVATRAMLRELRGLVKDVEAGGDDDGG